MLGFLYRWRYRRAQKIGAYKIPSPHRGERNGRINLGSYLSQDSVRGRTFGRFDLPRKRSRWVAMALVLLFVLFLVWVVTESLAALALFRD